MDDDRHTAVRAALAAAATTIGLVILPTAVFTGPPTPSPITRLSGPEAPGPSDCGRVSGCPTIGPVLWP